MKKFEGLGRSLSKMEQKKIMGGYIQPTCRHHCNVGGIILVSDCQNKSAAQQGSSDCNTVYGSGSGGWCCDSCESAGWGGC